jgi:hypothetical protein
MGSLPQLDSSSGWHTDAIRIIDEHHAVRDHAVVSDLDQLTNETMRLDAAAAADDDATLDLNEWPDECIVADPASVQIGGRDNCDAFTELDIADCGLPHDRVTHS